MRHTAAAVTDGEPVHSAAVMSARLAREVRRRRSELGMSQQRLVASGSISLATLGAIESGRPRTFTAPTLAALDRVLGWEVGHAQAIIDDETAAEQVGHDGDGQTEALVRLLAEYRAALDEARRTGWQDEIVALAGELDAEALASVMALMRLLARRRR